MINAKVLKEGKEFVLVLRKENDVTAFSLTLPELLQLRGYLDDFLREEEEGAAKTAKEELLKSLLVSPPKIPLASLLNVQLSDIWTDPIPFCPTFEDVKKAAEENAAITLYEQVELTELPDSDGLAWYLRLEGERIYPWISPNDSYNPLTLEPGKGFEAKLYSNAGKPLDPDKFAYLVDYPTGIVVFHPSFNPKKLDLAPPRITVAVYTGGFGLELVRDVLYVVGRKSFKGDGETREFKIDSIDNVKFYVGSFYPSRICLTRRMRLGTPDGKVLYSSAVPGIRKKVEIEKVSRGGVIRLTHAPKKVFTVWFWYELSGRDIIAEYERDSVVRELEAEYGTTK